MDILKKAIVLIICFWYNKQDMCIIESDISVVHAIFLEVYNERFYIAV